MAGGVWAAIFVLAGIGLIVVRTSIASRIVAANRDSAVRPVARAFHREGLEHEMALFALALGIGVVAIGAYALVFLLLS